MRTILIIILSFFVTHCVSLGSLRGHKDEWEALATAETMGAVTYPYCSAVGDRIYVVGGIKETNRRPENIDAFVFDLPTRRWRQLPKNPQMKVRANYAGATVDNKIYIFGAEFPDFSNDADVLDLPSGRWSPLRSASILDPRARPTMVSAGRKILIYGGKGLKSELNAGLLDTATGAIDLLTIPAKLGTRSAAISANHGNEILIWGGFVGKERRADGYLFNAETKAWTYVPAHPGLTARANASTALWNNKLYVFGGDSGNQGAADVWIWDFATKAWSEGPDLKAFGIQDLRGPQLVAVPGRGLLLLGGRHEEKQRYEPNIFVLKTGSLVWEKFAKDGNPPGAVGRCTGVADGHLLYVLGGLGLADGEGSGLTEYDQIWLYDWPTE